MSKEQENLRDKFEGETNLKCWSEPHFEDVGFSDKYVEWLEKQLLLHNVVGQSEQLFAFGEHLQKHLGCFLSTEHLQKEIDSFKGK